MRFLKYLVLSFKYDKSIDFILAIGDKGRTCFEKTRFNKVKIYDWAYFTEQKFNKSIFERKNSLPKLLFVGSIDSRKIF